MNGHTSKPWRVVRTSSGTLQIRDHHDKCVAMFDWHKDRTADAHLIAAAPELYTALSDLVDYYGRLPNVDSGLDERLTNARAAIAKSTGETK